MRKRWHRSQVDCGISWPGVEVDVSEQKWLTTNDPSELARHRDCRSHRKLRLLSCAIARRVLFLLPDERYQQAIDVAERYADGRATDAEVLEARRNLTRAGKEQVFTEAGHHAAIAVLATLKPEGTGTVYGWSAAAGAFGVLSHPVRDRGRHEEMRMQCDLAREVFGNPYRRVHLASEWRNTTVLTLAQTAYEDRQLPECLLRADLLAILADALEDAGCHEAAALDHLRQPAEHVRGCWLVDLVLRRA